MFIWSPSFDYSDDTIDVTDGTPGTQVLLSHPWLLFVCLFLWCQISCWCCLWVFLSGTRSLMIESWHDYEADVRELECVGGVERRLYIICPSCVTKFMRNEEEARNSLWNLNNNHSHHHHLESLRAWPALVVQDNLWEEFTRDPLILSLPIVCLSLSMEWWGGCCGLLSLSLFDVVKAFFSLTFVGHCCLLVFIL